jgi:hypothetical protein
MDIYGGTLHLISGKEIPLPDDTAVEAVMNFWESVPKNDDVPSVISLTPTLDIVLTRSSIIAIERVGSAVTDKTKR